MIVHGFMVDMWENFYTRQVKTSYHPELVISCGKYVVKTAQKMKKESKSIDVGQVQQLLSIFYANFALINDYFIFPKGCSNSTQTVVGDVNDFTSINIDNQDKKFIRALTHFNFSSISNHKLYLNNFFSNCKIMRDDFETMKDFEIIKYFEFMEKSDYYNRIRAIVPHCAFDKIKISSGDPETFSNNCFYVQFNVISKRQGMDIKYSRGFGFMNQVFYVIHTYLSQTQNFYPLKRLEKIYIDKSSIQGTDTKYLRYSLIIDMHNVYDSKSYLHNLFVIMIAREIFNISNITDELEENYGVRELQIILPHNKAKEYKLIQNNKFYDIVHTAKTIEQIINNSVVDFRIHKGYSACIILKE